MRGQTARRLPLQLREIYFALPTAAPLPRSEKCLTCSHMILPTDGVFCHCGCVHSSSMASWRDTVGKLIREQMLCGQGHINHELEDYAGEIHADKANCTGQCLIDRWHFEQLEEFWTVYGS